MKEIKHNDLTGGSIENSVDRRTALKGAVALGVAASITACGSSLGMAAGLMQEPQETDTDGEYGLYAITHSPTARFDGTLRPQPVWFNWSLHTRDRAFIEEIGFRYVTWATAEQAEKLTDSEHVESVSRITPESVVVIGQPENANNVLTVRLFPNAAKAQFEGGEYASAADIASEWRQELDNIDGLVITAQLTEIEKMRQQLGDKFDEARIPIELQARMGNQVTGVIKIEFQGELDETVLAKVTSHPQTLLIQWGEMVKIIDHCPGCGMG